jgi:hypothetical protein
MSRDEILKMSMEAGFAGWKCDEEKIERFFSAAYEAGAAAEREACAKRLEAVGCDHCAANIRARGEK